MVQSLGRMEAANTRRPLLFAYLAACAVVVAFFLTGIYSVDTFNHVARLTVECTPASDPLRAMWRIEYGLIPNLAIDLINRALCGIVTPEHLIPALTGMALAVIFAAGWRLQRLLSGQNSALVLLLPAIAFNLVTYMGFTNYLIGIALLIVFAVFLYSKPIADRGMVPLLLVTNAFGIALFFCHAFAAVAGLVVLGMRLLGSAPLTDFRAWSRAAMFVALGYAVPIAMMMLAEKSSSDILYYAMAKPRIFLAALYYGSYSVAAVIGLIWAVIFYVGAREKLLSWPVEGRRLALAFLLFMLLVPTRIGKGMDIDARLALPTAIFLLLSLRLANPGKRYSAVIAALGLATMTYHLAVAIPARAKLGRQVAELRAAAQLLPRYATVLTMGETGDGSPQIDTMHFHIASVLTVERAVFNPLEFSGRGMQPMDAAPGFACRNVQVSQVIPRVHALDLQNDRFVRTLDPFVQQSIRFARGWPDRYSHILYIHEGRRHDLAYLGLEVVKEGSYFTILRNPRVPVTGPEGPCKIGDAGAQGG